MTSVPAVSLIALGLLLSAVAQQQPERTVGSLLMLANGGLTATHLREALAHDDPLMRIVGTRLIAVNRISGLAPLLKSISEKETDPGVAAELAESVRLLALNPFRPTEPSLAPARIAPPWIPGLLARTAEAAGCRLGDGQFGVAEVTYASDGRPTHVNVRPSSALSRECLSVLVVIARTTLLDRFDLAPEGTIQWLIVPFSTAYADCTREVATPPPPATMPSARPPRMIKHVRPEYPPDLLDKRIEGTVAAVGVLSPQGCVQELRVIKSIALGLDVAALQAMSGWLFEAPRLDGKAFATRIELTVNFTAR